MFNVVKLFLVLFTVAPGHWVKDKDGLKVHKVYLTHRYNDVIGEYSQATRGDFFYARCDLSAKQVPFFAEREAKHFVEGVCVAKEERLNGTF